MAAISGQGTQQGVVREKRLQKALNKHGVGAKYYLNCSTLIDS